ncbi:MAG: hypothetical protein LBD55_09045 [Treponema sp.]|jgi:hypothetical protein|nr:hypothetical protein [Treponema sp.]
MVIIEEGAEPGWESAAGAGFSGGTEGVGSGDPLLIVEKEAPPDKIGIDPPGEDGNGSGSEREEDSGEPGTMGNIGGETAGFRVSGDMDGSGIEEKAGSDFGGAAGGEETCAESS